MDKTIIGSSLQSSPQKTVDKTDTGCGTSGAIAAVNGEAQKRLL